MYYTYVLLSLKDNNFYTGFTNNLKLRFEQHNKGLVESTEDRRPFELIYYEACVDQRDAIKREKYLKTYHGKMFLKRRLKSYLTGWKGSNKLSDIELSKYLNISETSLEEVVCCLDLILDDGHISEVESEGYLREAEGLGAQLIAFGRKVRKQGTRL